MCHFFKVSRLPPRRRPPHVSRTRRAERGMRDGGTEGRRERKRVIKQRPTVTNHGVERPRPRQANLKQRERSGGEIQDSEFRIQICPALAQAVSCIFRWTKSWSRRLLVHLVLPAVRLHSGLCELGTPVVTRAVRHRPATQPVCGLVLSKRVKALQNQTRDCDTEDRQRQTMMT
jgi:hypothetical protein